mmetsp:Transcript_16234/g.35162  ORF Transcript_16234/g.35162 Transcript_16234/m.35162 type:complete len:238 (-) Transcript_16234:1098-1811(-)
MAARSVLTVPSSMASFSASMAALRSCGSVSSSSVKLVMSRRRRSFLDMYSLWFLCSEASPKASSSSSSDFKYCSSLLPSSSKVRTVSTSVPKDVSSIIFATTAFTSALLKLSGFGRASYSALFSSSNSMISSSSMFSMSASVYSCASSLYSKISCLFFSKNTSCASLASRSLADDSRAACSSLASFFARLSSASKAFVAFIRALKLSSMFCCTWRVSYAASMRIRKMQSLWTAFNAR